MEGGVGEHLLERAFELAHVGAQVLGDVERHFVIQLDVLDLGLLLQNGDPHFHLGRLDLHRQPPVEAGDQAVFEARNILRVGVAADHDLLARLDQGVEDEEELFLRAVLAVEELHVVEQQHVERTVVALEGVEGLGLVGADHVGVVILGVHVADHLLRHVLQDVVADGVDQVGLAEAGATVDEHRVVRCAARVERHLHRGRAGQIVGLADDQVVEGEAGNQPRFFVL